MARTNAAQKLEPLPERERFTARELLAIAEAHIDLKAVGEADRKYGNDYARELADLEAGNHPTQRAKNAG
ncbi:MAG: hypothetical protein IPK82_08615 [Polyangiaceae bacterium]|nr:hypothetical protein [Polyangiaceae bacterium]